MSRNPILALLVSASLCITAPAVAAETGVADGLGLVFAERDHAAAAADGLAWRLMRDVPEGAVALPAEGMLGLRPAEGDASDLDRIELHLEGDGADRVIGRFPAEGGDPVLLFFLETTARDIAQVTGGSPIYIRNRIKDAFRSHSVISVLADGGRTVTLTPFADDANAARMGGFDGLTLEIGLGPEAEAPIRRLSASAPSAHYSLRLEIAA